VFALISINPGFSEDGVAIRSISPGSASEKAGIIGPDKKATPMDFEVLFQIDSKTINSVADYHEAIEDIIPGEPIRIRTDKNLYTFLVPNLTKEIILNETKIVNQTVEVFDEDLNETVNTTEMVEVNKTGTIVLGADDLGIVVMKRPKSNVQKGLDLQGGTRLLLEPEEELSPDNFSLVVDNLEQRLNVFGLSDVNVQAVTDLPEQLGGSGKQFVLVEIAGVSKNQVDELLSKQGKFEANIGETTVFKGGDRDITYVCLDPTCSGIDPRQGCSPAEEGGYTCRFSFAITLSPHAAKAFGKATENIEVDPESAGQYLTEEIVLSLDDVERDRLSIATSLRGRAENNIQISGSGSGANAQEARTNTLENMKELQTLLKTGSLPTKMNIVSSQSVSATLGEGFLANGIKIGLIAALGVAIVVYARYRKLSIVIPMLITSFSEVLLLLGLAALIRWNIDVAAIAGFIVAVGTGVDHQIVITDEILYKEYVSDWKKRIKSAMSIILAAFMTTVVAMIPLLFAGAGLLKGFALITIFGLTIGVFISRPAYAAVARILLNK